MTPLYDQWLSFILPENVLNDIYVSMWIFIAVDVLFRLYIGFSARTEGRGKLRCTIYLVITAIYFLVNVAFIVTCP